MNDDIHAKMVEEREALRDAFILRVAEVAHEANRALSLAFGDDSQLPWSEAPEWQRDSAIEGVVHVLENPAAGPEAVHQSWLDSKRAEGWVYGPIKDPAKKCHPCLVEYDDLAPHHRAKDHVFRAVVLALAMPTE